MKTPEQWDKEGVCYASVAKQIQDDALQGSTDLEKLARELELELIRTKLPFYPIILAALQRAYQKGCEDTYDTIREMS